MNDEDSGEWKCIAENEVGSAEESENIYVQTIPDIIQKKQREHLKEFETLNLECLIVRVSAIYQFENSTRFNSFEYHKFE